jgi:hypothetical protein
MVNAQLKKTNTNTTAIHFLNGNWISTNYIEELKKTKSPLQAAKIGIYQLFINSNAMQNNSLVTDMWTINEGAYGFTIYLKAGIKKKTWQTNWKLHPNKEVINTDIGLQLNGNDTTLVLYHYTKAKKLIEQTIFIKPNTPTDIDKNNFLAYQVNATLITGKYTVTDSVGRVLGATFSSNSGISGFDDFTRYYIVHFSANENIKLEEIYLITGDDEKFSYTFTIEENKILLYALQKTNRSAYTKGALIYTLVRKE